MSDKPSQRKNLDFSLGKYMLDGEAITWQDAAQNFVELQYYYVYGDNHRPNQKDQEYVIAEYKKTWLSELAKSKIVVSETRFNSNGYKGVEIRAISAGRFMGRFFFTPSRFVAFLTTQHNTTGFEPLVNLLDSFHYLNKTEYVEALIAENTPAPMPQTPMVKRPQTDLQENGLKGRVRSVIADNQESSKKARQRESEDYYDESGNLVKAIYFHNGYPSTVGQWGWLDGQRVVNDNLIEYGSYEGPNENEITQIIGAPDVAISNPKPRDNRFSNRYEYKYDTQNRLSEKTIYQNDGSIWMREIYTYKNNIHEHSVLDEKGKLNSRRVELLDANGNVIEERAYDFNNKLEDATLYKYEFDSYGNWIVQKSFTKKSVKGKIQLKPGYITFRQISYFD